MPPNGGTAGTPAATGGSQAAGGYPGTGGHGGTTSSNQGGTSTGGHAGQSSASCPAAELGALLGRDRLLVGGMMDDTAFAAAPFDLRYKYLAGNVPATGPCNHCAVDCYVGSESCAGGCEWWGCWQYDQLPPGRYVADFLAETAAVGAVPMITYYIWFSVAGYVEGPPEIAALNDGARIAAYLNDFRFLCQVMAEDPNIIALLHIEPDLWGYGHKNDDDPTATSVALSAAAASECSGLPDTLSGLSQCMLAIARDAAPNVLVGFHASAWGAGHDALINDDPGFDLTGHAQQTAQFMSGLTADADFVVVEMSDRDAGFNGRWWDPTNQQLPHFTQAIEWVQTLGEQLGLAPLWWQVPYGHMGLENVPGRYEDNRVAYFFDHPSEFAAGKALGIAFGAGSGSMTTPETDDGYFVSRAAAYFQSQRPQLCGD